MTLSAAAQRLRAVDAASPPLDDGEIDDGFHRRRIDQKPQQQEEEEEWQQHCFYQQWRRHHQQSQQQEEEQQQHYQQQSHDNYHGPHQLQHPLENRDDDGSDHEHDYNMLIASPQHHDHDDDENDNVGIDIPDLGRIVDELLHPPCHEPRAGNALHEALLCASRTFHHDDTTAHDDEVRAGAVEALVWRLGYTVGQIHIMSYSAGGGASDSGIIGGDGEEEQGGGGRGGNDRDGYDHEIGTRSEHEDPNHPAGPPPAAEEDLTAPLPPVAHGGEEAVVWSELSTILATLSDIICKCSATVRLRSFESSTVSCSTELVPLLVHLMNAVSDELLSLEEEEGGADDSDERRSDTTTNTTNDDDNDCKASIWMGTALLSTVRILRSYAKLPLARPHVLRYGRQQQRWGQQKRRQQQTRRLRRRRRRWCSQQASQNCRYELLDALVRVLNAVRLLFPSPLRLSRGDDTNDNTSLNDVSLIVIGKVRTECLGLVKDLTYRCTEDEAEIIVTNTTARDGGGGDGADGKLLDSVLRSAGLHRHTCTAAAGDNNHRIKVVDGATNDGGRSSSEVRAAATAAVAARDGEYVASAVWNLALAAAAATTCSGEKVQRYLVTMPGLIDALVGLIGYGGGGGGGNCTIAEKGLQRVEGGSVDGGEYMYTIRYPGSGDREACRAALSALGNLARGNASGDGGNDAIPNVDNYGENDGQGGGYCARALISHGDGLVLEALLSVAAAPNDDDVVARRRAVRAVRCLAQHLGRRGGGSEMTMLGVMASSRRRHIRLARTLAGIMTNDPDRDVRVQAVEALASLYRSLGFCDQKKHEGGVEEEDKGWLNRELNEDWGEIASALVGAICTTRHDVRCVEIACKALTVQLSLLPPSSAVTGDGVREEDSKAYLLAEYPALLQALLDLVAGERSTTETHDVQEDAIVNIRLAASGLLHELSKHGRNRDAMLLSLTAVVDSLASLLVAPRPLAASIVNLNTLSTTQTNAAGTVAELARSPHHTKALVDHPTLLASFVNYCATAKDGPVRDAAKEAVLKLVPLL